MSDEYPFEKYYGKAVCPWCGVEFQKKCETHKYCCISHRTMACRNRSPEAWERYLKRQVEYIKRREENEPEFKKQRRRYFRLWYRKKYKEDPEFREKIREKARKWHHEHKAESARNFREWYHSRCYGK